MTAPTPASPTGLAPTRQRRKQARPQELLDAALELFVEKGYAATRSEEVAVRAGVSKGTLYVYYPSKEELLKEVVRHNVVNQIAEGVDVIRQFQGSSAELLAHMLRLWWQRVGETRASGIIKLMMSEARNFPDLAQFYVDEVINPSHAMLGLMVSRGVASGEFRNLDVARVVHNMVAPLLFMVMNKHALGVCPAHAVITPQAFIETQIDLLLHGLLPRPAAPSTSPPAAKRKHR